MLTFKQFYYIIEDASTDQAIAQVQAALGQIDTQINQRTQPLLNQKQQLQRRLGPLLKKKQDDDKKMAVQNNQQQNIQQDQLRQQAAVPGAASGAGTPGGSATTNPIR
jgi:hypothetical protein